jgi:SAM-dependent methyltransferase
MKESWASGGPYEYFMGRWSRLVAQSFIDWLSPPPGLKWLDVGCGSGALSSVVIKNNAPSNLIAIDQSEDFVAAAQKRLGNRARLNVGNALALPLEDSSVNVTVSGLVLNFISKPKKALAEMRRVTTPGGTVALYVWDYAGKMDFLSTFWDVAAELNPQASSLHEGKRFPDTNAGALKGLYALAGFMETVIAPIEIETHFRDFNDYWNPFLGHEGPAPTYVTSLDEVERNNLRDALSERLPIQPDGSISMSARAWAASGQV